jgi:hypothetical protein
MDSPAIGECDLCLEPIKCDSPGCVTSRKCDMAHFFISPKSHKYLLLNPNYLKLQQLILSVQCNSMLAHLLRDKYRTIISLTPYYAVKIKLLKELIWEPMSLLINIPMTGKSKSEGCVPLFGHRPKIAISWI